MKSTTIHIISSGKKWKVKRQGKSKALFIEHYREIAYHKAMLLDNIDAVFVHNKDGSLCFSSVKEGMAGVFSVLSYVAKIKHLQKKQSTGGV